MQRDPFDELRRQATICNACRYCEGYCAVFPAMHAADGPLSDGDAAQLANLCHNCRGCHYACQYAEPHEFAMNLPRALAEARRASWQSVAWPRPLARIFHTHGGAVALAAILGFAAMLLAARALEPAGGEGFYAVMSHAAMVAIFAPAFLAPLAAVAVALRRQWRLAGGAAPGWRDLAAALRSAATTRELSGGAAGGCNFEDGDRHTQARRHAHTAVVWGFALCFASTCAGTFMHYALGMPAPYPALSPPKLLGVPGGLLLAGGCAAMLALKLRAERGLGDPGAWGGEIGFIALLGFVALGGLALWALGDTAAMPVLLALHLGSVLALFLLTPYSKAAHGFHRFAALVRDAQRQRRAAGGG